MTSEDVQTLVGQSIERSDNDGASVNDSTSVNDNTSVNDSQSSNTTVGFSVDVIDIRKTQSETPLIDLLRASLSHDTAPTFPSLFVWNEEGLQMFEAITHHYDYYLSRSEIEVLEGHSDEIARNIQPKSILLELGSGNPRKVMIILQALEKLGRDVDYFALDVDYSELQRGLEEIAEAGFNHVRCHGLLGTFDDAHAWLQLPENAKRPRCVAMFGSTLGASTRTEAAEFLTGFNKTLHSTANTAETEPSILLGLDGCKSGERVHRAYVDPEGLHARFALNALDHANRVLGYEAFRRDEWTVQGEWDEQEGCMYKYLVPLKPVLFEDINIKALQRLRITASRKYDAEDRMALWKAAGLTPAVQWDGDNGLYEISILKAARSDA